MTEKIRVAGMSIDPEIIQSVAMGDDWIETVFYDTRVVRVTECQPETISDGGRLRTRVGVLHSEGFHDSPGRKARKAAL